MIHECLFAYIDSGQDRPESFALLDVQRSKLARITPFGAMAACFGLAPVSDQPDIANSGPLSCDNYIPSLLSPLH